MLSFLNTINQELDCSIVLSKGCLDLNNLNVQFLIKIIPNAFTFCFGVCLPACIFVSCVGK